MTEAEQKDFMETLAGDLAELGEDVHFGQDENTKLYVIQASLPITEDKKYYLSTQVVLFPLYKEEMGLEVIYYLTSDIEAKAMEEVKKAVNELNYISPFGHFGVREDSGKLYMRFCSRVDIEKDVDYQLDDALMDMNIAMATLQSGYIGLRQVWEGKLTFEEAVEKDFLRRSAV